jgi:hypothetical protein
LRLASLLPIASNHFLPASVFITPFQIGTISAKPKKLITQNLSYLHEPTST